MIPASSPSNAISVTCVDRLETERSDLASLSAKEQISILIYQWGGSIALGALALVGLWMLRRGNPAVEVPQAIVVTGTSEEINPAPSEVAAAVIPTPVVSPDLTAIVRDEIHSLVESDPVASASLLGDWLSETDRLETDGTRRTAILILSLDQVIASAVLGRFPRDQVERITLAIATVENVTREEQELILGDFKTAFLSRPLMQPAGPQTARELLERTLDRNEVDPIQQRIKEQIHAGPFAFLHHRHADDIRRLIEEERPQTIAVIAAHLPQNLAAQVLARFDAAIQADILSRLARLGPMDADLLIEIASLLHDRIGRTPVRDGGIDRAANVLSETARSTTRSVLQSLDQKDARLAETLRGSLFSFKDLASLDDDTFRLALQKTDHCQWAVALKGSSRALSDRVFKCLSEKLAGALKDEINSVGPIPLSRITAVQRQIAELILMLDSEDQIELPRHKIGSLNTDER